MIQFIIRNYNDTDRALRTYRRVLDATINTDHSVLLYDDGSDDQSLIEPLNITKVLRETNRGELEFYYYIRKFIDKPYIVFLDSDDDLAPHFVKIYEEGIKKLESESMLPMKLDFRLNVHHWKYRNNYSFTHINSMAYSLICSNRYIRYTNYLETYVTRLREQLGYEVINLNSDTYVSSLLNLHSLRNGDLYNVVTNLIPATYIIDAPNAHSRNVDRQRFLDGDTDDIYNNPKLKERWRMWMNIIE